MNPICDLRRIACRRLVGCFAVVMAVASVDVVDAQNRSLSVTKYTNGAAIRRAFLDVVKQANRWTVRVKSDGQVVAFGTVVRKDGYIISKASQLNGDLSCRFMDGTEYPAEYVGYSADHDVALLRVDAEDLTAVRWQKETDPEVGRWVITPDQEGAPNGVGVVSVARREIPRVKEPAVLGIQMMTESSPVVVEEVKDGSPAERAKLRKGDVIHQVDDVPIVSPESLKSEISRHNPGDTVTLHVRRQQQELTLRATLSKPFGEFQSRIAMQNEMGGNLSARRTGFPVVLQHDTVLDPNQCGGPLVDLSGRAVGINIARAGRTESYAIPDDVIRSLIDELLAGDYPPPGEREPTVAADLAEDPSTSPPESDTSRQ